MEISVVCNRKWTDKPGNGNPDVLCAGSTVGGIYPVSDPGIPEMDH